MHRNVVMPVPAAGIDGNVYKQQPDHCRRCKSTTHHQPWICDFRGIGSLRGSIRGTWKRNVLVSHYTFKICSDHITGSLYRKSFLGSNGSLECIRNRRNADGNRRHINMEKTENVEKCKKSVNVSIDNLQINDMLDNVL